MKVAIDKFKTIKDNNYCVRVTSDEGDIGREFLEMFQNNDRDIPAILTSSKMLTTGVDAKNVRNVVLTAPITVRDLESTNGTWIDKQRITEFALEQDTAITIGPTVIEFHAR